METPLKTTLNILLQVAQALEVAYWNEVQNERVPSYRFREVVKRLRVRIYNLQKSLGVLE
jgi:hypothetical protein